MATFALETANKASHLPFRVLGIQLIKNLFSMKKFRNKTSIGLLGIVFISTGFLVSQFTDMGVWAKAADLEVKNSTFKLKPDQSLSKSEQNLLRAKIKNIRDFPAKDNQVKNLLRQYTFQKDIIQSQLRTDRKLTEADKEKLKGRLKTKQKLLKDLNTEIKARVDKQINEQLSYEEKAALQLIEPNYLFEIQEAFIPNDPLYDQQWGLQSVGALPETLIPPMDTDPVIVAVIDTGVDFSHPDLQGIQWQDENCLDENNIPIPGGCLEGGYDFVDNDPNPFPDGNINHGHAIAGIIAAQTENNNGMASFSGIHGNQTQVMSLRSCCTAEGFFESDSIARAIYFAVNNGADIINASFGGPTPSENIRQAIQYARDNEVIFVAAAGNYGSDVGTSPLYPASFDESNIVSVASHGNQDTLSYFSNYGSGVDLAAPGENITVPNLGGNAYQTLNGTSFSTPFVSSVLSVLMRLGDQTIDSIKGQLFEHLETSEGLSGKVEGGRILSFEEATSGQLPADSKSKEKKSKAKEEKAEKESKPEKAKKPKKKDGADTSTPDSSVPEATAAFAASRYGAPILVDASDIPSLQNTEFPQFTTSQSTVQVPGIVYHHADHLTGANVDTDTAGTIVSLIDYYPYGETWVEEETTDYENDYKFTGKEKDEETGLYYYEARYYDSSLGRFASIDPWSGDLLDPQSLNKYSYVKNNPVKYVDPTGKEFELFIRRAGFWNANNFSLGAQFGHVIAKKNGVFYGFSNYNENTNREHNVQIFNQNDFDKHYKGQTWEIIELKTSEKQDEKIFGHFSDLKKEGKTGEAKYSAFTNNCTHQMQNALEKGNVDFGDRVSLPGDLHSNFTEKKNSKDEESNLVGEIKTINVPKEKKKEKSKNSEK
jgi:RHS repeat-associated protein